MAMSKAARSQVVLQALSDTMPGHAWQGPENHPHLQVGAVRVCLLSVADHVIELLDIAQESD